MVGSTIRAPDNEYERQPAELAVGQPTTNNALAIIKIGCGKERKTPPMEGLKRARSDAIAWLYSSHGTAVDSTIQQAEKYSGLPRENLVYGLLVLWALYMMVGGGAQFVSNLIGFVYPCYASVLAIRTENTGDDTQWLIYWTTFASFFLVDSCASVILTWFPFYFILKSAFLVYLWLPQTMGAQYLYWKYVDPAFTYIEIKWLHEYYGQ